MIRDRVQKQSKYSVVTIPPKPDETIGYHSSCYRSYCAIKDKNETAIDSANELIAEERTTSSIDSTSQELSDTTSQQNILNIETDDLQDEQLWVDCDEQTETCMNDNKCIFCSRKIRRRNGVDQKLTKVTTEAKKNRIVEILGLQKNESKLKEIEKQSNVNYHLSCLSESENKVHASNKTVPKRRKSQLLALVKVQQNVIETIIQNNEVRSLNDIYQYYKSFFEEEEMQKGTNSNEPPYKSQYLLNKLLQSDENLTKTVYNRRTYVHRRDVSFKDIYNSGFEEHDELMSRIKKVGLEIRKKVKQMKVRSLPKHNLSVEQIVDGECDIPKELFTLIESIVKGPRALNSDKKNSKIIAICSSLIFTMTNGFIKPASVLMLGLATKSMTGSRKMMEVLNRMGCSISYTLTEEIETELAFGCSVDKQILPYGLRNAPNLRTHVAFDNFDRFVETSNGKFVQYFLSSFIITCLLNR